MWTLFCKRDSAPFSIGKAAPDFFFSLPVNTASNKSLRRGTHEAGQIKQFPFVAALDSWILSQKSQLIRA